MKKRTKKTDADPFDAEGYQKGPDELKVGRPLTDEELREQDAILKRGRKGRKRKTGMLSLSLFG